MSALAIIARQFGGIALPDDSRYKHKIELRSASSSRLYIVSWDTATNQWVCKCPGFLRHRTCKHLANMRPAMERATGLRSNALGQIRPKLKTAAEEAQSAKQWARINSGDAYKHFNPMDGFGYGSPEQWEAAASGRFLARGAGVSAGNPDLELLGLVRLPRELRELRRAYRLASLKAHPDAGGTAEAFRALHNAYERLESHYQKG